MRAGTKEGVRAFDVRRGTARTFGSNIECPDPMVRSLDSRERERSSRFAHGTHGIHGTVAARRATASWRNPLGPIPAAPRGCGGNGGRTAEHQEDSPQSAWQEDGGRNIPRARTSGIFLLLIFLPNGLERLWHLGQGGGPKKTNRVGPASAGHAGGYSRAGLTCADE